MNNTFYPGIDIQMWKPLAPNPSLAITGVSLISDLRNNEDRHPEIFSLVSTTVFNAYHVKNDGWSLVGSPALTGAIGAGSCGVYAPSHGVRGTIATGATTTSFTPSATIGATIGANQLAGRGDKRGYKVRICNITTGVIEERYIVANTGNTTTPLITLDVALTTAPTINSTFEILSGRAYLMSAGATVVAGFWKYWDPALNIFSGNLSVTGLATSITTDSSIVCMDEQYVPQTNKPGEGFLVGASTYNNGTFRCLLATGSTATTITGQAVAGDVAVLANEYRNNFQIRIVEDTVNPTAINQRRKISSHTAGPSAVYTVPTWTVTPSTSAKFVIENANEILFWNFTTANTHTYSAYAIAGGQAADSWSTTTYAARPSTPGTGCVSFQAFGMELDIAKNCRYSQIYSFRGNGTSTLDIFDLSNGVTGTWSGAYPYSNIGTPIAAGTSLAYDPVGVKPTASEPVNARGCFAYLNINGLQPMYRFNALTRSMNQWKYLEPTQSTVIVGQRLATSVVYDATDGSTMGRLIIQLSNLALLYDILIQR